MGWGVVLSIFFFFAKMSPVTGDHVWMGVMLRIFYHFPLSCLVLQSVEGLVEPENGEDVPIKLLDCDSITQAKEKVLDALYKNCPASKRPQLTEIDLSKCDVPCPYAGAVNVHIVHVRVSEFH